MSRIHASKRRKLSHNEEQKQTLRSLSPSKWDQAPRKREQKGEEDVSDGVDAAEATSEGDNNSDAPSSEGEEDELDSQDDSEDLSPEEEDTKEPDELRTLSFGALADAQDALPATSKRRRSSQNDADDGQSKDEKLRGLRDRLAELREKKTGKTTPKSENRRDQEPSDHHRTSKHAPQEQSSKRQVTRRREVTDTSHLYDAHSHRNTQGDPRFSAAGGHVDREKTRKNYGFLRDLEQNELVELKTTLDEGKKRKRGRITEEEEARLKKEIVRRENRMKSEAMREREAEVAAKHKREERQRVKEGKTPYYMKRGEVKRKARDEAWEGMKGKEREKSEMKRRRRQENKEMKRKPEERRVR